MSVSKEEAVAVCQEYGFATADGWEDRKLLRKLEELVDLYRSGEWEPRDVGVVVVLARLAKDVKAGKMLVFGSEGTDDRAADETLLEDTGIEACCPLNIGDRVVVSEEGVKSWKGIVDEILSEDSVLVRGRDGETWETTVDKCEVKIRAVEAGQKGITAEPKAEKSEKPGNEDEDDAEIRSLQERIRALKSGKKGSRQAKTKKLRRDEIAVRVLRAHPEGGVLDRLAEEVEARWKKQGRRENLSVSVSTLKRLVAAGVLFGILRLEGREVAWVDSKEV